MKCTKYNCISFFILNKYVSCILQMPYLNLLIIHVKIGYFSSNSFTNHNTSIVFNNTHEKIRKY